MFLFEASCYQPLSFSFLNQWLGVVRNNEISFKDDLEHVRARLMPLGFVKGIPWKIAGLSGFYGLFPLSRLE